MGRASHKRRVPAIQTVHCVTINDHPTLNVDSHSCCSAGQVCPLRKRRTTTCRPNPCLKMRIAAMKRLHANFRSSCFMECDSTVSKPNSGHCGQLRTQQNCAFCNRDGNLQSVPDIKESETKIQENMQPLAVWGMSAPVDAARSTSSIDVEAKTPTNEDCFETWAGAPSDMMVADNANTVTPTSDTARRCTPVLTILSQISAPSAANHINAVERMDCDETPLLPCQQLNIVPPEKIYGTEVNFSTALRSSVHPSTHRTNLPACNITTAISPTIHLPPRHENSDAALALFSPATIPTLSPTLKSSPRLEDNEPKKLFPHIIEPAATIRLSTHRSSSSDVHQDSHTPVVEYYEPIMANHDTATGSVQHSSAMIFLNALRTQSSYANRAPIAVFARATESSNSYSSSTVFRLHSKMALEESEVIEFKNHVPDTNCVEKNINAFLNSDGGHLFCGVTDKGIVCGVALTFDERFAIRKSFDDIIRRFTPTPDAALFSINFHHLQGHADGRYLVVMSVKKDEWLKKLIGVYFTGVRGLAFQRWSASVTPLKSNAIAERISVANIYRIANGLAPLTWSERWRSF